MDNEATAVDVVKPSTRALKDPLEHAIIKFFSSRKTARSYDHVGRESQKNRTLLRVSFKVMEEEKWKGIPGLAVQWRMFLGVFFVRHVKRTLWVHT